jgi:hypothetical protein
MSLRAEYGSIATTPLRVVSGPTTTTRLPMMIHPSLAVADLQRTADGSTIAETLPNGKIRKIVFFQNVPSNVTLTANGSIGWST